MDAALLRSSRAPLERYTRSVARKNSACGVLLAAAALAQISPPQSPILRGLLLESDARVEAGEFAVRGPQNEVFRYRFDSKTRVERGGMPTAVPLLSPGEAVEVSSAPIADSPLRYAVSVFAVDPLPPPRIARPPRAQAPVPPLEPLFSRGDLTLSGVVSFLTDGRLILRTRSSGEQTILLRNDTRYLAAGAIVKGSDLKANMRVFVRAGKDLFGHTEAYQVMWGGFLQPHVP